MAQDREALLSQQISEFATVISSYGLVLQIGTDFDEFLKCSSKQPLRHPINPIFDPEQSEISRSNGFWILGHDKSGEIVHTQAMKLLDLTHTDLEGYLKMRPWDLRPFGNTIDPTTMNFNLTEASARITGRVTYHGELWIKGGPDGFRGGCLTILLTRLMILLAMLRWTPDFLIGLQSPFTAIKGLAIREGYMHMEQQSILWPQKKPANVVEDWLVWMNYTEAEFNLRLSPETLLELFEPTDWPRVKNEGIKFKTA